MANVKISELPSGSAAGTSVVPASDSGGTVTNKVTLASIAALATSNGAVGSNTTQAGAGTAVNNIVTLTQAQYNALTTKNPNTIYFVQ
jgi:hypothetical protein